MQKTCVNNTTSEKINLYRGVPQGTVFEPLLFRIYVNVMRQNIAPLCQILQYADDTMLYTTNEDFNITRSDLDESLSEIS